MAFKQYQETYQKIATALFSVDSPSGYTDKVTEHVVNVVTDMGYPVYHNNLGNVIVTVEGEDNETPTALSAHVDTLGLVVRSITSEGYLMFSPVGGPVIPSLDGEYCRIRTRSGAFYTGTILSLSPAKHVFADADTRPRDVDNMAVRIDELVHCPEDVKALGIRPGDFICFDTKTEFTKSGFLKSRFIDDKGCAALLLTTLQYFHDENIKPKHKTYFCFTTHEEIGYGGATLPSDIEELLVVDMGCVGSDLQCKEEQVSICTKDSTGPYDYRLTTRLMELSESEGIDYAMDIYPRYSSDAAALWRSGCDARAALIGPGVHASHGMERTHLNGLEATFDLMVAYLTK